MVSQQPIGVIKDISGKMTFDTLALYSDSCVLVRGTVGHLLLKATSMQFGAIGALILYRLVKRSENKQLAKISGQSPDELARSNPKNLLIPYNQIVAAQLKKSLLSGQLLLTMADGTSRKLKWPKGTNKYDQVAALLSQALGTKLSEVA